MTEAGFMEVVWFSKVNFFKDSISAWSRLYICSESRHNSAISGRWLILRSVRMMPRVRPRVSGESIPFPDKLRKRGYSTRLLSDLVKNLFNNENRGGGETYGGIDKYSLMPLRRLSATSGFPQNRQTSESA